MWAAQQNHYYVVHLLLERGADPSITDIQGYNILHLATFSGNAFLLILLLHQEVSIDVPDPQGHTPLMWAAYKGFPLCVDLFLRWGANVNAVDDAGLTPLHWSLVRGSLPCISKMLDYDADRFAKTKDGKSPDTVAAEIGTTNLWHRALKDHGYGPTGQLAQYPLGLARFFRDKGLVRRWFYCWPWLMILAGLYVVSDLPVYFGLPAVLAVAFMMQFIAQKVGSMTSPEFRDLQRTPFLAGIFSASLFYVIANWMFVVLPGTYSIYPLTNLLFAIFGGTTSFFFIRSMRGDPGFVPKLSSRHQQRQVMHGLMNDWKFDDQHFCVICLSRKPLRSKHCKRCKRCVSKHDHHCPWIDNCVGVNNLRSFVIYILTLEIGILLYLRLVALYILLLPTPADAACPLLADSLCELFNRDSFTIVLGLWAAVQLVWVTLLCGVQLVQISRNTTTYEIMRKRHYGLNAPTQALASAIAAGTTSADNTVGGHGGPTTTPTPDDVHIPRGAHGHGHGHSHRGCLASLRLLLGIDTFMATATDAQARQDDRNPFSHGCLLNCKDFWCDGTPVCGQRPTGVARLAGQEVNYHQMYEVPFPSRPDDSMLGYRSLRARESV
ncbi:palmitoyltransferase akr1 [Ascosphaera acerosa]|nr:palmitoyltransferase akr1 [Ascosphaera acerosa]